MELKLFGKSIIKYSNQKSQTPQVVEETPTPQAAVINDASNFGGYNRIYPVIFDGEKDLGEIGPIKVYTLDHQALRMRSWQALMDSDVCAALVKRSCDWVIGTGLKLQAMPKEKVLKLLKSEMPDAQTFDEDVEALFDVFSSTYLADYAQRNSLNEISREAWKNCIVGGDVLMVMYLTDGVPKVKLIDGQHVCTPLAFGNTGNMEIVNPDNNNVIRHGVEIDKNGKHVAYWVCKQVGMFTNLDQFDRYPVEMKDYPYCQTAKMIYGLKYRIDNVRGIPMITAVMETAAKMSRYREATISGAEERAKITLTIEHEAYSTGENPITQQAVVASGFGMETDLPADSYGENLANRVYATTNKQTYNMPNGAKMKAIESKQELSFAEFYSANFDIVCAVVGYPPEVILSKYNSNYSASRAAIKDFEHTIILQRQYFSEQFNQMYYNFCLDVWVLQGLIKLPGYEVALMNKNLMALAAYRFARFAGDVVPHIDPAKEVKAWREKLGEDSKNVPLCTVAEAMEALAQLGGTDFNSTIEQYAKELEKAKSLGIDKVLPKGATMENEDEDEEDENEDEVNPKPKKKK